jgi:thymidine phosphorylase
MSSSESVIHAKRDAIELRQPEIRSFVRGITDGTVTDAQLGAFAMAVCVHGMSMAEQTTLTIAMRDSGQVLDWPGLDGPVLDKHSTGGVGDMVSLILGPMIAACGGYVPMISGRGLGHTGGTLDKLESIPGFRVDPDLARFRSIVKQEGVAIIGQTGELAPADRRTYATRDVTSTVESIPLIVSSILSKKLAEGLDGLVLDVKTGNGAFMREQREARKLAANITAVSASSGLPCTAVLTDMNQPLAWSAGNALEIREVLDFLAGREHPRLKEVILALGSESLQLGGLASGPREALERLRKCLDSGAAAERFGRFVTAQGGPADLFENRDRYLPVAPIVRPLLSGRSGYILHMETRQLGLSVMSLGGGRRRVEDTIDARVGLSGLCSVGDPVERDTTLAVIHAASEDGWQQAAETVRNAIRIGAANSGPLPCIYETITGAQ